MGFFSALTIGLGVVSAAAQVAQIEAAAVSYNCIRRLLTQRNRAPRYYFPEVNVIVTPAI